MTTTPTTTDRIKAIAAAYGTGPGVPDAGIWDKIAEIPENQPVTLVNFFKMRATAEYPTGAEESATEVAGSTAFDRYAATSVPTVDKVGGKFLALGPFGGAVIGGAEDWDLVAIGTYPDTNALLALFEDEDYQKAYPHRTAACAAQRVSLMLG